MNAGSAAMVTASGRTRAVRYLVAGISMLVLLLTLLALDDITTGHEADYILEWLMVAAGGLWFGGVGIWLVRIGSRTLAAAAILATWKGRGGNKGG